MVVICLSICHNLMWELLWHLLTKLGQKYYDMPKCILIQTNWQNLWPPNNITCTSVSNSLNIGATPLTFHKGFWWTMARIIVNNSPNTCCQDDKVHTNLPELQPLDCFITFRTYWKHFSVQLLHLASLGKKFCYTFCHRTHYQDVVSLGCCSYIKVPK
jgi:hypothetical protein